MSNNLLNIAMSGINSANTAMSTIGNNISSSKVEGYKRQTAIMSANNGLKTADGYLGTGAHISKIQREYDSLIDKQYNKSLSNLGMSEVFFQQSQQISKLFAESDSDINSQLNQFFKSIATLSGNAGDQTSRLQVLNDGEDLVNRFKFMDNQLTEEERNSNERVTDYADQVSTLASQIAKLNHDIFNAKSANSIEPFDMLNQREIFIHDLSRLVEVKSEEVDGFINLSLSNGMDLVYQDKNIDLVAFNSNSDSSKVIVGVKNDLGVVKELTLAALGSGKIVGELKYRNQVIDSANNQLNQTALIFAESMNQVHKKGFDLNNAAGIDMFTYGQPEIIANSKNSREDHFTVTFDTSKIGDVQASEYTITRKGSDWEINRLSDNTQIHPHILASGNFEFDGLVVTPPTRPISQEGDTYQLITVQNAIPDLKLNIISPDKIAAKANRNNGADNAQNLNEIFNLQQEHRINGKKSFAESLISLSTSVGDKANKASSDYTNKSAITKSLFAKQESISGVNLDEEYLELNTILQYYQANAKVLATANQLFDILINNLK